MENEVGKKAPLNSCLSITLCEHWNIIPILLKAWREVVDLKNSKESIIDGGDYIRCIFKNSKGLKYLYLFKLFFLCCCSHQVF